ncbi:MAG: DNA alkylation repair protein [Rhodobacterales bacterium]|nr:DNA alkylation repair protein [Rhodobacterales bacterium]
MTVDEALDRLRALRNPTMWDLNERNGARQKQFGVKMGDIRGVAKEIKTDHALALQLWATEIVDARLLAILILKPEKLTVDELDRMVRSNAFLQVSDWLNSYVVKAHPQKEALRDRWMATDHPFAARAGWSLTAERVQKAPEGMDLSALLDRIEAEMPGAPEPVQWTMNNTLAAIGIHHQAPRARAIAIGERLGVYRDYTVSKGCTSPFAPIWMGEMVRRAG